jgi:glycosyltransferase involved in cell wall biosynthesis
MNGGNEGTRPLRIAIVAPPLVRVPPRGYAGTERIVAAIALGMHARGHQVTVFASGDSELPCEVVPVVPHSVWERGVRGDQSAYFEMSAAMAWEQHARFDIIHSHVEQAGFLMSRHCPTPVVSTLHKRLDVGGVAQLIDLLPEIPLIAISESQRRWNPDANWVATIHHGLDFSETPASTLPGDYLLLVGRLSPDKGIAEAIEVARRSGHRLVMAVKKAAEPDEHEMFERIVRPAIDDEVVDWRGEVAGEERDRLMAGALATLMLGAWPEPFGLVAIESMATGTPVIARRAGGVTETVVHGSTGFLVDDVNEAVLAVDRVGALRRERIAGYARGRYSADRMTTLYEEAYAAVLAAAPARNRKAARLDVDVRPGIAVGPEPAAAATLGLPPAIGVASVADLGHARRTRSIGRSGSARTPITVSSAAETPAG